MRAAEEPDRQSDRGLTPSSKRLLADGLEPEAAARHMSVPEGFRVQLAAGEPQVHQPIAFTLDDRGRVWVAEAYTYPLRAPEGQGRDKIVILDDTDGDGTLDSRVVFAEGLNLVSGLELGFGGVFVGAAPYLLFIPDRDGDDQPDGPPEILLDGFGYQDTHETLNAFIWGPDGWLYGCHGVFTHSRVGKPGTPEDERIPLNAGVWRYHPTRHEFEVFAWGTSNPWGVDFNDHGQAFITACVIPHLWHMIQGGRYERQGGRHFHPHVYGEIATIADHRHYAGDIRDHAWWGQEPDVPTDTLAAGGGHAHCGAMIYLADNWPKQYRNQIFMNNIHGNRVNNDILRRAGSGFVGEHGPDIILANDRWYRGINLKYGPDGSVYLIDWYDRNACHRTNPEIWDRSNGRIYNVAYGEPDRPAVRLRDRSDSELVALQLHANDWYVRTARRLLQERAATRPLETTAVEQLRDLLANHTDVSRRLRALWCLHVTGNLASDDLRTLLSDDEEYVRAWAIQLEQEDGQVPQSTRLRWEALAQSDPSPVVRLYLASALQRLPLTARWKIAEALLGHGEDASDHNLPLMYWYGLEPLVPEDPVRAITLACESAIPRVRQFVFRRAASDNESLPHVVNALARSVAPAQRHEMLDAMLQAFEGRVDIPMPKAWQVAYEQLLQSDDEAVRNKADEVAAILGDRRIFPRMREVLTDASQPMPERQQALSVLVKGRDPDAASAFRDVLEVPPLRGPAIRALAAYSDPKIPSDLVAQYGRLTEEEQRDAINTLVARPEFALELLDAIQTEQIPRTALHAYNVRQLLRFDNEELNTRIRSVWGKVTETSEDKRAQIAALKPHLTPEQLANADPGNGRRLFSKTCASCHTLFGEGGNVGPDITGSNRANLDYILENIVDPSAVLGKDYRLTLIVTVDGRIVSGLVQKETDSAVTLRTINDTVVVAKKDIDVRQFSDQSMMPERLLETLKTDEIQDLIAYLGSTSQVPLRGPEAPIDAETGRVPGALEAESLKIIGKSAGQARSQDMAPFPKDRWSDNAQLWWTGAQPGSELLLEVPVPESGTYRFEIVLTRARDYAVVQLSLAERALGGPLDLFHAPDVVTTGVLSFDGLVLEAGTQPLRVEILGANPQAVKSHMVGIDYVRLVRETVAE